MKKLVILAALMLAASTSWAFQPKELVTFGAGVKWSHAAIGQQLIQDKNMWGGVQVRLPLNDKVGVQGIFERDLIDQPVYTIRAGVWFRI